LHRKHRRIRAFESARISGNEANCLLARPVRIRRSYAGDAIRIDRDFQSTIPDRAPGNLLELVVRLLDVTIQLDWEKALARPNGLVGDVRHPRSLVDMFWLIVATGILRVTLKRWPGHFLGDERNAQLPDIDAATVFANGPRGIRRISRVLYGYGHDVQLAVV